MPTGSAQLVQLIYVINFSELMTFRALLITAFSDMILSVWEIHTNEIIPALHTPVFNNRTTDSDSCHYCIIISATAVQVKTNRLVHVYYTK